MLFRATLRRADEGVRPYIETNLLQDDVSVWVGENFFLDAICLVELRIDQAERGDTGFHWSNFDRNAAFLRRRSLNRQ